MRNIQEWLTNESKRASNDPSFLKTLPRHVEAQLEERPFCVVFADDLKRCWPTSQMSPEERNSEIHRFAESQGWSATILEGVFGTRAIFQRLEPDVDYEGSSGVPNPESEI
jgi:hypothetical protein